MCLEKAFRSATCGFWQLISLAVSPATSFLFSASGMRPKRIAVGGQNQQVRTRGTTPGDAPREGAVCSATADRVLLVNTCSYATRCFPRAAAPPASTPSRTSHHCCPCQHSLTLSSWPHSSGLSHKPCFPQPPLPGQEQDGYA